MSRDLLLMKKAGIKLLVVGLLISFAFLGRTDAKNETPGPDSLFLHSQSGGTLPFNPAAAKWQFIKGELTVFAINTTGAIDVWIDSGGMWRLGQSLTVPSGSVSCIQLQDLDKDGVSELIAGTADSGFLYVYHWTDGIWTPQNSDKYVWSTITGIAAGYLDDTGYAGILVQNREGFLYLYKQKDQALELVWKSPTAWRPFATFYVADLDGDHRDDIVVSYKNGAIAVLKMINNSIVSVWENFVWGKILAITTINWDNPQAREPKTKLVFSTTQKMIYLLGHTVKGFQFEAQLSQFPFIAEALTVPGGTAATAATELLAIDTAGKFHILQYSLSTRKWGEIASLVMGRAAQMVVNPESGRIWVWGVNQNGTLLKVVHSREIRLIFQEATIPAQPPLLYQKGRWYLAARSIAGFAGIRVQTQTTKTHYRILVGNSLIEVSKKQPAPIRLDGASSEKAENCLVSNNEPYLSLELWRRYFNLQLNLEATPPKLEISLPDVGKP